MIHTTETVCPDLVNDVEDDACRPHLYRDRFVGESDQHVIVGG